MKRILVCVALLMPLTARNPFVLLTKKLVVADNVFILKSTALGLQSVACLAYKGQSYTVVVGDVVDGCEVIEINGGFVCLQRKNGTRCALRLEEERNK